MTISRTYKTTLVLPFVENVHNVLIAFLRTAESGEWKVDAENPSDQFVMHFIRGKWRKPILFGRGIVPVMHNLHKTQLVAETVPMRLKVRLLPSPQDLTITLEHEAYAVDVDAAILDYPKAFFDSRRRYECYVPQWNEIIGKEVVSLRAYLKKCYNLPELPNLGE